MAGNTTMTAKSTFGDGLLMDFAPDNTQATCLTHALNATLLTMNGNELSLQNDMGNGRVETAYLPEGYVPVGTCEFGDIIYIVSYNPITNKSQIGCFPSPERNISSKELSGTETTFDLDNFVKTSDFGFKYTINNSIKQVIYENNLNPGDKFIVHSGDISEKSNIISDYGNTSHKVDTFPKQYKINIVAIEESGKINYLNSDLKWYTNYNNQENQEKKDGDFYINAEVSKDSGKPDIDSYRNILNSGYSVFQSKVSGKLAILIELERIESFNSTYEIYTKQEESNNQESAQADTAITNIVTKPSKTEDPDNSKIQYKDYSIYINFNWETNNPNINPSQLIAYDFKWVSNSIENSNNEAGSFICGDKNKKLDFVKDFPRNTETTDENTVNEATQESNSDKYIYRTISNYKNFSTETYAKFVKSNYDAFITNEKYANATKINQSYADGKPEEGKYYLNLHHIVENKYYDGKGTEINPTEVPDCIVNNYFKSSISKHMFDISIPSTYDEKAIDCRNLILSYKVAPMMEYGVLSDLVQTHYIDFSKIGSGEISLNGYKYYNGENLCTLQIDSSVYPEENKGVAGIELQFYDNQGQCAVYNINNRASYSGIITSYIPLNGNQTTYNLSSYQDKKLIAHAGQVFVEDGNNYNGDNYDSSLSYVYLSEDEDGKLFTEEVIYTDYKDNEDKITKRWCLKTNSPTDKLEPINFSDNFKSIYYNDAGTLYSNMLYAVKIVYKYTTKNALGEYDTTNTFDEKCEWRWLWTNTMFNQYYYNVSDFKDNKFELQLDISADYSIKADLKSDPNKGSGTTEDYEKLGVITQTYDGTIKSQIHVGLENTYNTFSLYGDSVNNNHKGIYEYFSIDTHIPQTFDVQYDMHDSEVDEKYATYLKPSKSETYGIIEHKGNIYDNETAYKQYADSMQLTFKYDTIKTGDVSYMDSNQNLHEAQGTMFIKQELYNAVNNPIQFDLKLRNYNKYYQKYEEVSNLVSIEPITRDYSFLQNLGIKLYGEHFYFENVYLISPWKNKSGGDDAIDFIIKFKVDPENYTMNLSKLTDLPNMMNGRKSSEYSGYWIKWGQGTASRSQLSTSGKGWFMSGPSNCKHYDSTIDINYGFFLNLRLPFNRNQYVNRSNQEVTDSKFTFSSKWDFKTNYPSNNNQFILAQIGFMGDKKEAWHLFNDYCVIDADGNYTHGYGSTVKQLVYNSGYTIADYLVAVLNSMYIQKSYNGSNTQHTSNIEYEYTSTYTQDIVYKLNKDANCIDDRTILIHGVPYDEYINQIEQHTGQLLDSSNKLHLNSITKNLPISINIESKKDSVIISNLVNNTEEKIEHVNASQGIMQIQDGVLMPINSNFKYKNGIFSTVKLDSDTNILDLKIEGGTNTPSKNAYSVFNYSDGQLILKRDTAVGAPENYSWTNQNRHDPPDLSALYDLFKSECLINNWQLV